MFFYLCPITKQQDNTMDNFIDALLSNKTDRLVGKVHSEKDAYWIFSDITADSFHWENVRLYENGERFLVCEIFGKRING